MTSAARYNNVAQLLHWLIAIAIIGLIVVGKIMVDLPRDDPNRFAIFQLHKSFGLTVLALTLVRIAWRLLNPPPALPSTMKPWEKFLSHATHAVFYFMMIAIPMSGWVVASTSSSGVPTVWFGLFEIPHLPGFQGAPDMRETHEQAEEAHEILANLTILLIILHVAAALKHHFWDKDDVLRRMSPFSR